MRLLSVVIPNYNYGEFVAAAVDSALQVDWPNLEVIVVDDGSTDNSLEILERFDGRIKIISQQNAGPREACNRGFAESYGDVVIFLDSDDVLEPSIAREVHRVWHPGISKVQVQMQRIDRAGTELGTVFPSYRSTPTADNIRHWMQKTAAYPTPPGSGNIYARPFLESIFPLDDRCGDATDSACLAAAPFLGDVVTVPKPLVRYRVHGRNRSSLVADSARFTSQLERAHRRQKYAIEFDPDTTDIDATVMSALFRGRHLLQMRVAERRVCAGVAPLPTDGRLRMFRNSFSNVFAPGPESMPHRVAVAAWCLTTLLAPISLAKRLIAQRFS